MHDIYKIYLDRCTEFIEKTSNGYEKLKSFDELDKPLQLKAQTLGKHEAIQSI